MTFRFRIERVENLGAYSLAYGTVGDSLVISNLPPDYPLRDGAEYDFSVPVRNVRYFDKKSGVRIKKESLIADSGYPS